MEFLFYMIFIFVIVLPIVLGIILPIHKKHNKATGGVVNYDSSMRKFVYKVYMSKEEIINSLITTNDIDDLTCKFDFERSVIRFSEYGSSREYFFEIRECDGFSILQLDQVSLIGMQSHIPYKLNPFLVSKLSAEIIPFSKYGVQITPHWLDFSNKNYNVLNVEIINNLV